MSPDEDLALLVSLAALPGIGPATLVACRDGVGVAAAWEAIVSDRLSGIGVLAAAAARRRDGRGREELVAAARALEPSRYLERHRDAGVQVLVHGAEGYPERLLADPAPPAVVFLEGAPNLLAGPVVAIVGTRNATRLGCDTAAELASDLAACGISIASGLALGIDGASHAPLVRDRSEPCAEARGRPIAVVATGLDHTYPRRHGWLQRRVAQSGALMSESPLGVGPQRWRFPARNRIIAGIADALVVVESRSAGGSMLTVSEALRRDVPVLAVPGHPSAPASSGTLDLICDGAVPVRDAEDVLVAIGRGGSVPVLGAPSGPPEAALEGAHDRVSIAVLAALAAGPQTLSQLVVDSGCSLSDTSTALEGLEAAGQVSRSGPWFERRSDLSPSRTVARPRRGAS